MKKCIATVAVLLAFLAPLVAVAQEEKNSDNASSCITKTIQLEVNLLGIRNSGTGNSKVFDPNIDSKEVIGPEDRRKLLMHARFETKCLNPNFEFSLAVYVDADDANFSDGQDSAGLEVSLLFPIHFLTDRLKVGFHHNSAHNFVNEATGRGTDVTAFHIGFDLVRRMNESLTIWGRYNIKDKASPYFLTADAGEIPIKEIGRLKGTLGFEWVRKNTFRLSTVLYIDSEDNLASIKPRLEVTTLAGWPNLFFEYHLNLKNTDLFGQHELLLGPVMKF
ncbi:hypothetical protein IIA95_04155 [Patescibacteria group bacterium]|nr:hypothetical protein [Patescibacteria group bacterium]